MHEDRRQCGRPNYLYVVETISAQAFRRLQRPETAAALVGVPEGEPPKRLSPDPPTLTPTYLSRWSGFCRPRKSITYRRFRRIRVGSPDSSDPPGAVTPLPSQRGTAILPKETRVPGSRRRARADQLRSFPCPRSVRLRSFLRRTVSVSRQVIGRNALPYEATRGRRSLVTPIASGCNRRNKRSCPDCGKTTGGTR